MTRPYPVQSLDAKPRAAAGRVCRHLFAPIPIGLSAALLAGAASAGPLDVPHAFSAGQPAVAAEVNANFAAVESAVDDNAARIAQLEAMVATLQSQVAALQASAAMTVSPYLDLVYIEDPNDGTLYPTVRITGANLQVVDGSGPLSGVLNGLGNLIVGYNALDTSSSRAPRCSVGSSTDAEVCAGNGGVLALNHRSGSHNIVVGDASSYSSIGGLVAGYGNLVSGPWASVSGGWLGTAGGFYSSISGGRQNVARGIASSVAGGRENTAFGVEAAVTGGQSNVAVGTQSAVSGGRTNRAEGRYSAVGGGDSRTATGRYHWAAGSLYEVE